MNDYEIGKKLRDCLVHLTEGKVTERKVCIYFLSTIKWNFVKWNYLECEWEKKTFF